MEIGAGVYLVSIMAAQPFTDADGEAVQVEHRPVLCYARSEEDASDQAHARALSCWPPAEGWIDHCAVVSGLTDAVSEAVQGRAGEAPAEVAPAPAPQRPALYLVTAASSIIH